MAREGGVGVVSTLDRAADSDRRARAPRRRAPRKSAAIVEAPAASGAWPAIVASVVPARDEVVGFARRVGVSSRGLDDIKLATSEACTNAVLHAYEPDREGQTFAISCRKVAAEVVVEVCDHGRGLGPRRDSPGLGLGLALIAQLAEKLEILTPPGGGTQLRMSFGIDPIGASAT
jgi:serine/threonine-protein kinase RsbW